MMQVKRLFKHRWMDSATQTISPALAHKLSQQVIDSERKHTGEIRVCVEAGLPNSYLLRRESTPALVRQRALAQFGKLRVWDTEHNNGVLIYLLLAEHAIEVVADRGLNAHMSAQQWASMVERLGVALRAGQFEQGLSAAIDEVCVLLTTHFPATAGVANPNELPDKVVLL